MKSAVLPDGDAAIHQNGPKMGDLKPPTAAVERHMQLIAVL